MKMLSTAACVPDVKMSKQQPFNLFFRFSLVGSSVGSGPVRGLGHSTQRLHAGTGIFTESAFWTPVRW